MNAKNWSREEQVPKSGSVPKILITWVLPNAGSAMLTTASATRNILIGARALSCDGCFAAPALLAEYPV